MTCCGLEFDAALMVDFLVNCLPSLPFPRMKRRRECCFFNFPGFAVDEEIALSSSSAVLTYETSSRSLTRCTSFYEFIKNQIHSSWYSSRSQYLQYEFTKIRYICWRKKCYIIACKQFLNEASMALYYEYLQQKQQRLYNSGLHLNLLRCENTLQDLAISK